jgi:hypothetical protein
VCAGGLVAPKLISYFLKRRKTFTYWRGSLPEKIELIFSIGGRDIHWKNWR